MKFKIFKFNSVKSTNDTAINLIKRKRKEFGCVLANKQTNGRGTYGKKWISIKGNLFLTIFFPLKKKYPTFNEFYIINSVIISKMVKKICKNKNVNLKFPNDILINKRKICGILQEVVTFQRNRFLIIGVGLNLKKNPKIKKKYKATNIFSETKKRLKIKDIARLIIFSYENFFINLNSYDYLYFKKKAELMVIDK